MERTKENTQKFQASPVRKGAKEDQPLHILLIDDDPLFLNLVAQTGKKQGVIVTTCRSLSELSLVGLERMFDVAIIDLYLDGWRDALKGTEIASLFKGIPIVLVSRNEEDCIEIQKDEPEDSMFMVTASKAKGPNGVLEVAMKEGRTQKLRQLVAKGGI